MTDSTKPALQNQWVMDLLDVWLEDIHEEKTLDRFITKINRRKVALQKLSDEGQFQALLKTYKDIPKHSTIYGKQPLAPTRLLPPAPESNPWKYHTGTLWQWMPRRQAMWVVVDWRTDIQKWGKNFVFLTTNDLRKSQPSRTEPDVRHRALRAGSKNGKYS